MNFVNVVREVLSEEVLLIFNLQIPVLVLRVFS